ncbi:MAG: TlpA family protein disulfide reductase [Desulfofustis sp.]|nr:TlpA family protein disulfide reductase [Desulfofustis sp.]
MSKQIFYVAAVSLWLLGATVFAAVPATAATKMPAFKLEEVASGTKIDSTVFAGKSLLITFFASWCPPCIQEIPTLIGLQKKYGQNGFSVIGLSVDKEERVVRDLVAKRDINYPVMMATNALTVSFGGVYGVPTSFLVNSSGTVVKKYTGYVPETVLVRDLEQIID